MSTPGLEQRAPAPPRHRATHRQHLVTVILGTWLMLGLFVDGWAHNNLDTSLETFFTPWHGLFYSGFAACAAWTAWLVRGGLRRGLRGAAAVPQGYGPGVLGLVLFALGGVGDMTWHLVFGIEQGIDALFSPTHLLLFAGIALVLGSPFRDAWRGPGPVAPGLRAFAPALASITLVVALVGFFFMYWSAFSVWSPTDDAARYAAGAPADYTESLRYFQTADGVAVVLFTTLLLVAPLLLVLLRWRAPFGTAAVLFTGPALLLSALSAFDQIELVAPALVAGVAADVLVRRLRPTPERRAAVRVVAAIAPVVLFTAWFAVLGMTEGVWYPPEVWSGTIVWAGLAGLGLALLMNPAAVPPAAGPGPAHRPREPEQARASRVAAQG